MFGVVILPLAFWFISRRKPTAVARGFSRALVLAFGTSSSSAALPVSNTLFLWSHFDGCAPFHSSAMLCGADARDHF
jgi:hypothetical protein